ncbi:hypothetical protein [Prosthecobacter dejongeii]|uniref:Uncharacterized protein n=1 Tax=Prosthecobacter dejongeii TaxID=48465 RepID=A0A7W8DRH7_9BACT|nr:hypothetical protein [Prosthecobacter dejongeii]MBB5039498.1 hypothetical protein [Prosthecobacter dejongeii]
MAVARARADGRLVVEPGMTQIYTPADFQRRLENPALSDTLFELPGKLEDYGPEPQRQALLNMVNRAQTHEEAQGIVHAFQQMKRIGYQLENVSLHYRGNQGLDLIFRTASGELALVTTPTYAAVEAKHGKGLESLAVDTTGNMQGSLNYNQKRLESYLKEGDGSHKQLAKQLLDLQEDKKLESYAALKGSQSLWRLIPVSENPCKFSPIKIK